METQFPTGHSRLARIFLWLATATIIALGVYLSHIRFLDTEWLSRAGCVVVMLGIWSGLGGIIQERVLISRLRWKHRNALVRARARLEEEQSDTDAVEKELKKIEEAFEKQSLELTQKLRLSLGIMEVALLITGTSLWGFGDLLVR